MLANFNVTFKESPSIPIGILLDPLLKQMQVSDTNLCNIADFDFFMTVAKHSRLNLKNAIQVLDLLGKLYLNSPGFGRAAGIPFVIICTRFIESLPLQEYLFRFCKYAMKLVVDIEKAKKAQAQKKLPKYLSNALAIAGLSDELPEEAINGQRRIIIYDMVSRVISMFNPSLNERLKEELIACDLQIKRETGKHSKGVMTVLSLLGEAGAMLEQAEESEPKVGQTDQSEEPYKQSPRVQRSLESLTKKSSLKASSKMPKRRVLRDIERVKQKREEKEMKEILQLELKQRQDEKKGRVLKRQLEQKKIIAGRTPASEKLLFLEGVPDIPQESYYVDLSEETPDDQDGVNIVMKKYSRVLKLLYKKYSSTGHRNKDNKTFDMLAENKSHMSEAELYRLLKDQGVTTAMVTKDAHSAIFKAYCLKNKRGDNTQVDIDGYQGLIIQIALYIFAKPPKDLSIYPPAASVRALFDLFRTSSSDKGVSIKFYDEPDPGAGDKDIVKKLNQVLAKDPNAPLPDGYRRVMEKELDVKYVIPQTVRLPEATKVSLSVLDDLLNSLFGVHVLEPQFSFLSIPRARGILAAPALAPSQSGSAQSNSQFQAAPVPQTKPMYNIDPEIKFEMTKLGGRYPVDHVLECGKTLDDLIYSVEMRSGVVISRNKKTAAPIQNQVKLKKEMEIRQEELLKQRAEQRRKLRHQVVEEKLKKAKEEKEAKDREDKDRKKQEQQRKIQRLRKREEDRKLQRDEKEKQLKEWHEKQQEEEKSKSNSEILKKQQEEEQKKKLREEFLVKERKRISELMKGKINERQQTQQRTQEESKRKLEAREQNKQKLMQKIEQDKKKREEDKAQKEQVQRLLSRPDVAQVFQEYGKSIEAVFVHYCKLSTRTDQDPVLAGKALQFAGFNKFSTQFEIYPNLITPENNLQVFRQLTKDRPASDAVIALSLEEFKQALLKVAVAAQPNLQEMAGKAVAQVSNVDSFGVDTLQDFLGYLMLTPDVKKTFKLLQGLTTQTSQKKETSGRFYIGTPGVSRNLSLKRISHGARLKGTKPRSKPELKVAPADE